LGTTVDQLKGSQDRKAVLAAVPGEIQAVESAYNTLSSAVKTKCD
jgi:hypothetical protein